MKACNNCPKVKNCGNCKNFETDENSSFCDRIDLTHPFIMTEDDFCSKHEETER